MSDETVNAKFEQLFGTRSDADELRHALYKYGSRDGDREQARVQLAILKLSEGDPAKLLSNVEAALRDYRDVLAWAEFPEQMKSGRTAFNSQKDEYKEILRRDREQYLQWLEDTPNQENTGD